MRKQNLWVPIALLSSLLLLTGCFSKGDQSLEEMDTPQDIEAVSDLNELEENLGELNGENVVSDSQEVESEMRQLYLLDENGMVVPQSLPIPKSETNEVAKQVLNHLVKDGPVTNILPNGFQAVLPAGTEINGLNLEEDGTLIVDVSEEFTNYQPEEERKIIEAMTFTLTQFDSIERVKLRIEGQDLDVMPVNGTPISQGYTRANGINIHVGDSYDFTSSEAVTVYYPSENEEQFYYVPVTMPLQTKGKDTIEVALEALLEGPSYELAGLLHVFPEEVALFDQPLYEDGVLTVTFNEEILHDIEEQTISDEVMSSLVLTLTEQPGVESVNIRVNNYEEVYTESGEPVSEPVTREEVTKTDSI
ncbi:GerMN domain-containing protein [Salirhabdus salicampi]|uniref:GerMN domain-containing protein n=1 Tax=Salirhabdus salicampi TaxID=476102 RepID=UPI0020C45648|nr:GerMN domain-containing protein [Salirhabdus salicampi]MCP8617043.1 GerMN domain-containing protein [Salirhabdus salicampi]